MALQVLETNRSIQELSKFIQVMVLEYCLRFLMELLEMSRMETGLIIGKIIIRLLLFK
jgi:hypothetical protein